MAENFGRGVGLEELQRRAGADFPRPVHEDGVPGQAEDIVDAVGLAPAHQIPPEEAGIAAHQYVHLGPGLPDARDDPFDRSLGPFGAVDSAMAEFRHKQVRTASDRERQETAVLPRLREGRLHTRERTRPFDGRGF
jgi:hypothetical protein